MKKGQRIRVKSGDRAGCLGTVMKGRIHLTVKIDDAVNPRSDDGSFHYLDTEVTLVDIPEPVGAPPQDLLEIFDSHARWLHEPSTGTKANLSKADLHGLRIIDYKLKHANLYAADLSKANLTCTDLSGADLTHANLRGAVLRNASLCGANLQGADLSEADLQGADFTQADLTTAKLRKAYLHHTLLVNADLTGANLTGANAMYANFTNARLVNTIFLGADIDYASLTLWCGTLSAQFDDKILAQLAYHLVKAGLNSSVASKSTKEALNALVDFANKFHRVDECGRIEKL